jgi:hemerythrin-like domain-containing protein
VLLRFLREFVLGVHLRKEAELIYPAVAMRADDRAAELVGEVMRLNDEIHELTHTLIVFWEPVGELTPAERAGFAETVAALAARFTRLRTMEEAELFPSCDRAVPADDQLDWVRQFAQLEHERCSRAEWQALLAPVAQRWLG